MGEGGGGGGGGPGREPWGVGASEMGCALGPRELGATPLREVVTVVSVLRTVDCVASVMPCYWNSGEKWS